MRAGSQNIIDIDNELDGRSTDNPIKIADERTMAIILITNGTLTYIYLLYNIPPIIPTTKSNERTKGFTYNTL